MKIEVYTFIEVEGLEHEWAVELKDCKQEMQPIKLSFIEVNNQFYDELIIVDSTLLDLQPTKIVNNKVSFIAEDCSQVGFWKLKKLK